MIVLFGLTGAAAAEATARVALTPYQAAMIERFKAPSPTLRVQARCGPHERQCQIDAIYWCCRADQQCDYRYAGGCR